MKNNMKLETRLEISQRRAQKLYDALRHIRDDFMEASRMYKDSQSEWGLNYEEALEMAYDNMQGVARDAIRGMIRPKIEVPTDNQKVFTKDDITTPNQSASKIYEK